MNFENKQSTIGAGKSVKLERGKCLRSCITELRGRARLPSVQSLPFAKLRNTRAQTFPTFKLYTFSCANCRLLVLEVHRTLREFRSRRTHKGSLREHTASRALP